MKESDVTILWGYPDVQDTAVSYTNWKIGKPNDVAGNENCLQIVLPRPLAVSNDMPCNHEIPFICETRRQIDDLY